MARVLTATSSGGWLRAGARPSRGRGKWAPLLLSMGHSERGAAGPFVATALIVRGRGTGRQGRRRPAAAAAARSPGEKPESLMRARLRACFVGPRRYYR